MTDVTDPIEAGEEIIDSRDVIARIEYLEDLIAEDPDDESTATELTSLRELASLGEGVSGWPYGATLVSEDYFTTYAKEFAEDVGYTEGTAATAWPFNHINWEAAADDLKTDYTTIEWGGITYHAR